MPDAAHFRDAVHQQIKQDITTSGRRSHHANAVPTVAAGDISYHRSRVWRRREFCKGPRHNGREGKQFRRRRRRPNASEKRCYDGD